MCRLHADTPTRLFSESGARGSGNLCSARTGVERRTTLHKALLQNYGKQKSPQQPFDILKQETIIRNSTLLVLPIIFSPDTGGTCDERNQTTVFDW